MPDYMGPDFSFEDATGLQHVVGVDEVGRGPWAGPVIACAALFDLSPNKREALLARLTGLDDSKKLSAKRREALFEVIEAEATLSYGAASVEEIDALNILQASLLAMRRAVEGLPIRPQHALVDGNKDPGFGIPTQTIVKGDSRSLSIAAASVAAKVTRDRLMAALAKEFPAYGWEKNAGYGVRAHRAALQTHGVTPHHRRSFAPIKALI